VHPICYSSSYAPKNLRVCVCVLVLVWVFFCVTPSHPHTQFHSFEKDTIRKASRLFNNIEFKIKYFFSLSFYLYLHYLFLFIIFVSFLLSSNNKILKKLIKNYIKTNFSFFLLKLQLFYLIISRLFKFETFLVDLHNYKRYYSRF
jgi:hypothetical protein